MTFLEVVEITRKVLKLADLVLIPTRPSPNDLWSLGATLDLVKPADSCKYTLYVLFIPYRWFGFRGRTLRLE